MVKEAAVSEGCPLILFYYLSLVMCQKNSFLICQIAAWNSLPIREGHCFGGGFIALEMSMFSINSSSWCYFSIVVDPKDGEVLFSKEFKIIDVGNGVT